MEQEGPRKILKQKVDKLGTQGRKENLQNRGILDRVWQRLRDRQSQTVALNVENSRT